MRTPWIIHEADLALYPAWKDGLPWIGPYQQRESAEPVFAAKASLTISESPIAAAAAGHNWTGTVPLAGEADWEIGVSFPDGVVGDSVSRLLARLSHGGFHILVARFVDAATGEWTCCRWFYVTLATDDGSESGEVMQRSMRFKSTFLQETVGSSQPPAMAPAVCGEVDWICGPRRITCLSYDPVAESWTSLPRNELGGVTGTRYVNFSPLLDSATDVALSAYLPRVVAGVQAAPALPRARVRWENTILLRLGNHSSAYHHGLTLLGGTVMQTAGIVEPLLSVPQDRMLDEPLVVFRYLRRVYATLGHGVLAVPRLACNEPPPFTHDYAFRLAIPGDPNPSGGQSGLTLLPDGAWLDGTMQIVT